MLTKHLKRWVEILKPTVHYPSYRQSGVRKWVSSEEIPVKLVRFRMRFAIAMSIATLALVTEYQPVQAATTHPSSVPTITSTAGIAMVGKSKSLPIKLTGYPAPTLTEVGTMPEGLALVSSAGKWKISGTPGPGTGGLYPIELIASNSQGTTTATYDLTVTQLPTFPDGFCPSSLTAGTYVHKVLSVASWPPFFGLTATSGLPQGLSFTQLTTVDTGVISGIPEKTSAGKYRMVFSADNSNSPVTKRQRCTGSIKLAPSFSGSSIASLVVGKKISPTISFGGSSGYPTKPSVNMSGTLPAGVTASMKTGRSFSESFKGTPALGTAGDYLVDVTATNGVGDGTSEGVVLVVRNSQASLQSATLSIGSDTTSTPYGSSLTFHATVSGSPVPTGYVQFQVTGSASPTSVRVVTGQATFTTPTTLSAGSYTLSVTYSGDGTYNSATSTKPFTISAAPTSISVTPSNGQSLFGTSQTFVASVTSTNSITPQGQVTFTLGGTATTEFLDLSGHAYFSSPSTLNTSGDPYTVTATFQPYSDAPLDWQSSSGQVTLSVNPVVLNVRVGYGQGSMTQVSDHTTLSITPARTLEISVTETAGVIGGPAPALPLSLALSVGGNSVLSTLGISSTVLTPSLDSFTSVEDYFWSVSSGILTTDLPTCHSVEVSLQSPSSPTEGPSSITFVLEW